ncbi:unnamed protein product (macronuclear) [Paramecium tetraurelia]|uniref:Chromosome undetermined scaffold_138, whole genome shotgun sequence n=1 Tax=Paramecium tetraurelia TaxID=5888 RepID=Q3SDV0_PARTE|nr:uncharacterized protein GSPATT00033602001 [Paramecium tetraurelia]CAI39258.1 rab_B68 [Paramecium tetraurelia]CAK63749.1 unnamed protein product [Paramecium tetraurelia]|eukprot:XP_001431147.1 hypothetical protein (macronuclear) [Paramecium tetraurelia strain d4-2]
MTEKQIEFEYLLRIVLVGDSGSGKTTLFMKHAEQQFCQNLSPTIGIEFHNKFVEYQRKMIKLQLWDTAGQETFRSISQNYYRKANSIFFIYDITNKQSFERVYQWMNEAKQLAPSDLIKVLIGNKSDLINKRQVSFDEGKLFALENDLEFFELSAFGNRNLEDPIYYVLEQFLKQKESEQNQIIENNLALSNQIVQIENINQNQSCKC